MKRFDIDYKISASPEEDDEITMKIVTEKDFLDVANFAASLIGKQKEGKTILRIDRIIRRSDVDVI